MSPHATITPLLKRFTMLLPVLPELMKKERSHFPNLLRFSTLMLSLIALLPVLTAQAAGNKSYLRIEQNKPSDENDLRITTIGGLIFQNYMETHVDLSYLESDINGDAATLDFGVGYVFNWDISVFAGIGGSTGYNWDNSDYMYTYYPEVGVILDITNNFGLTISQKRIFNLYDKHEDIIMLGIVIR
ncbi:hypothetical protein MNBD_GAMMA09-1428 [hydrothermal vent metagenome]|uniref:Outer membrane protein beta-barrel domain-containing protein n=1 Tax=hydrothermal vent metagenome TaxID=652676 RepID=A0A3B0YDW5_9ZZZZ